MNAAKYRSQMLILLATVYAFQFVDRSIVMLLIEDIKTDLHLSDTQVGLLTGMAFAFFYATLGIPIARWADRGNRITIIALATGVWGVMVMCCGLAATYVQLLLARVGAAAGEAGCIPPAQSLISDYYARKDRARAIALYMLGGQASVLLGTAVAGWLNEQYGWRVAFLALGAPGLLLALLVRWRLHEPRLEADFAASAHSFSGLPSSYRAQFTVLWRQRAYRHITIGFTVIYMFGYGMGQWTPPFLIRTYGVDTAELGIWYGLIWGIGGMVGTYAGGYLVSRFAADNERLQLRVMAALLIAFIPLYLCIYLVNNFAVVLGLMAVGALVFTGMIAPLFALLQQVVESNMRATAVAIMLLFSNLVGMGIGPVAVGAMSDLLAPHFGTQSLRVSLVIWTPGYLWAVFHLLRAVRYVRDDIELLNEDDEAAVIQATA